MKRTTTPANIHIWLLAIGSGFIFPLAVASEEEIPKLRPPYGELPPSFWEQNGGLIVLAACAATGALVAWFGWLRRPKPVVAIPPEVVARCALEVLRALAEDTFLVVEVSRIVRVYLISALGLPPAEMTTAELHGAIQSHTQIDPALVISITDFLRQCDQQKFAPSPPSASRGVVVGALELVEKTENARRLFFPAVVA